MPDDPVEDTPLQAAPDAVAVPAPAPPPTLNNGPGTGWHGGLYQRVVDAIYALPGLFKTSLNIVGVRATDLFTLNSALGASIEDSVVDNLNALRKLWDPDDQFQVYSFVRQAQVFPDVRLQTSAPNVDPKILMGIELKGWFALAKEGEPSFRYKVSPAVCAEADLLVVFPWILTEVISGTPRLLGPYVTEARYAAQYRNHYWEFSRENRGSDAKVILAPEQDTYPSKGQNFNDKPVKDDGGNFGRVARSNIMTGFVRSLMQQPVAGIPLSAWHKFLTTFSEGVTEEKLRRQLRLIASASTEAGHATDFQEALTRLIESAGQLIKPLGVE